MPLLQMEIDTPPYTRQSSDHITSPGEDDNEAPEKRWWHYLPLCLTVLLILLPHPSLLFTLVSYYLKLQYAPWKFAFNLVATYTLTFLAFSSLIVCVVRDPGAVMVDRKRHTLADSPYLGQEADISLTDALMSHPQEDIDYSGPGKWCRKCWAPKPDRTHHCAYCRRCVLKMDHHCPWLAYKCIGHWTYTAFLHFLLSVSLLALYVTVLCTQIVYFAFVNPFIVSETLAIHSLFLSVTGFIFAIVMSSFFSYHIYLVTTNQTTLESLSPFLLLRYIPPLPSRDPADPGGRLSDPPIEHELSPSQRRLVRAAHSRLSLYDVGWRENWKQVIGWKQPLGWVTRLIYGGGGFGDGKKFPLNSRAKEVLARLATDLVDRDRPPR